MSHSLYRPAVPLIVLVIALAMLATSVSLAQTPAPTPSVDPNWVQLATFITMLAGGASALLTAGILVGRLLQKLDNLGQTVNRLTTTVENGQTRNDADHKQLKDWCERHDEQLTDHEKRVGKVERQLGVC